MGLRTIRKILGIILYVLGIFAAAWLIVHFVAQRTVVDGSSMETTLNDGDNLIIDKISYRFEDPKRFDIIVFLYQKNYWTSRRNGIDHGQWNHNDQWRTTSGILWKRSNP